MSIVWSYTSPCSVNWNGRACGSRHVWKPYDRHMTEKSADLQWERSDQNACWTSERVHRRVYYHSSLLEYRFTVWSIKPVMNTLLHDLNVEIGMTTESRVYRTLSWWHERSVWWHVEFVWWHVETATSSQPVLLPGELGSTVTSFGSYYSPTESPAVVTDDRPPWRTGYWGAFVTIIRFIL